MFQLYHNICSRETMKPNESHHHLVSRSRKYDAMKCQSVSLPSASLLSERMKNLSIQSENGEVSVHTTAGLTCVTTTKETACGECQACLLAQKICDFKEWFFHFGDQSKKHFMQGLLRQTGSTTILQNIVALLNPTISKDCIYARARTNPSLDTDTATVSSDHAVNANTIEQFITATWGWFCTANDWTKLNFTLSCLQMCEAHLLHTLYSQAQMLLTSELRSTQTPTELSLNGPGDVDIQKNMSYFMEAKPIKYDGSRKTENEKRVDERNKKREDNKYEVSSAESSECLHETGKNPELDFPSTFQSESSPMVNNHLTGDIIPQESKNTLYKSIKIMFSNSNSHTSVGSLDPLILVMPKSAEENPESISKSIDFIRYLPVHLSKMVLSMLDTVSLYNALCVSPHWCRLAEEVRLETIVNQQIKEEVMLMQGSAAHGANPVYAKDVDVLVPNLDLATQEIIHTDEQVINPTFKSEHNFQTAYSGISTKKVIMEERNIYCCAYNVMVVNDIKDSHRVVHTDGSSWVAVGSKDRRVRFVDCDTGKETGPLITGHAGSVTCCYLLQDKSLVLSGSYDTSVRCWSTNTGKCLKILRGHQSTVNCITVLGDIIATGSLDNTCKIWSLETGKCKHTLKHQSSVLTVALSEEICVSGSHAGKVKVWQLASGHLIKILTGHHSSVMSIKFDRWHIISGGKDAYALVWSTVGRHSRCLRALRHPKEVLTLEFAYLRVITGSADGRIRIWNLLTGQCCRMMRGNSQSDPVLSIHANGDRITVNTVSSLLVMNFEKVNWNYTLETDNIVPLTHYGSYSEFPLRTQSHPYVRAQRTRKAGAANYKLIHHSSQYHEDKARHDHVQYQYKDPMIPYSAKSLSRGLPHTKHTHSSLKSVETSSTSADTAVRTLHCQEKLSLLEMKGLHSQTLHSAGKSKTRTKSASSQAHTVTTIQSNNDDEGKGKTRGNIHINRRISWAFDQPLVPKDTDISLSEMKTLLRSQIRMKAESIIPPDFIYLTVSTIQKPGMKSASDYNKQLSRSDWKTSSPGTKKRPTSSPSRIDLRTKIPVDKLQLAALYLENQTVSGPSPVPSINIKDMPKPQPVLNKESFTTILTAYPVSSSVPESIHPTAVKATIPRGCIIRPVSAGPKHKELIPQTPIPPRPLTTPVKSSSRDIQAVPANIASVLPGASCTQRSRSNLLSTGQEFIDVPLLMSTKEIKDKIAEIKSRRKNQQTFERNSDGQPLGEVSIFNHPLRPHAKFQLYTHQEEENLLTQTHLLYADKMRKENKDQMRKKKAAWLALATGKL